jgi:hypothetical protein
MEVRMMMAYPSPKSPTDLPEEPNSFPAGLCTDAEAATTLPQPARFGGIQRYGKHANPRESGQALVVIGCFRGFDSRRLHYLCTCVVELSGSGSTRSLTQVPE